MAKYGTKEYCEEKLVEAETRVELLCYAFVHKIRESEVTPSSEQLRNACKVIMDACNEADEAKERYDACCSNENSAQTST